MKRYEYTLLKNLNTMHSGEIKKRHLEEVQNSEDWKQVNKFDLEYSNGFKTTYWFTRDDYLLIICEMEGEC